MCRRPFIAYLFSLSKNISFLCPLGKVLKVEKKKANLGRRSVLRFFVPSSRGVYLFLTYAKRRRGESSNRFLAYLLLIWLSWGKREGEIIKKRQLARWHRTRCLHVQRNVEL
jgi:hypothetical protein